MIITGELVKEGSWYAALCDQLYVYAQGRTRAAARSMLTEMIIDTAADYGLAAGWKVQVTDDGEQTLHITSNDPVRMVALMLRRKRDFRELSLGDVSRASGAKSRNGWSQYETALRMPSITKLQEMLELVAPDLAIAIIPRTARVIPRDVPDAELDALIADPSRANAKALRTKVRGRGTKARAKAAG